MWYKHEINEENILSRANDLILFHYWKLKRFLMVGSIYVCLYISLCCFSLLSFVNVYVSNCGLCDSYVLFWIFDIRFRKGLKRSEKKQVIFQSTIRNIELFVEKKMGRNNGVIILVDRKNNFQQNLKKLIRRAK